MLKCINSLTYLKWQSHTIEKIMYVLNPRIGYPILEYVISSVLYLKRG
jgi:hypothetical protein